MTNRNSNLYNEEQMFEKKLIQSMRLYGYLFPENVNDVEQFEALYGDTDIEIPSHLESLEDIESMSEPDLDFDMSINIAAFSSSSKDEFGFLDEHNEEDINDEKEESN